MDNQSNLLHQGLVLVKLGRYKEAVKKLAQAALQPPENALTLWAYGDALVRAGEVDEGVKQLQKALALAPTLSFTYNSLITAYVHQKKFAEANTLADEYLKQSPDSGEAHSHKALVLLFGNLGTKEEITTLLNYARSKDPTDELVTALVAEAIIQAHTDVQEVLAHFKEMLGYFPDSAYFHYRYGVFLIKAEQLEQAEEELKIALSLKPDAAFIGEEIELVHRLKKHRKNIFLYAALITVDFIVYFWYLVSTSPGGLDPIMKRGSVILLFRVFPVLFPVLLLQLAIIEIFKRVLKYIHGHR